jgi:hypothetical protein
VKYTKLFALAFIINLIYEVSHSLLYDWSQLPLQNTISFYIPRILYSTLGDAFIILSIFIIISLVKKTSKWTKKPKKIDYILIISLGLISSILIELRALYFNKWSYNQYMPLILGIGVTPLIQIALTSVIVLYFIRKI